MNSPWVAPGIRLRRADLTFTGLPPSWGAVGKMRSALWEAVWWSFGLMQDEGRFRNAQWSADKTWILYLASILTDDAMLPSDLKLITKADAAEAFSVSIKTIDNYIKDGKLPPPTLFVSKEYWHPEDFRGFLEQTFRRHSPEYVESTQAMAPPEAGLKCKIIEATKKPTMGEAKDSNSAVRQRSRQTVLLSRLNSP